MSTTKLQVSTTVVPRPDESGFTLIELLVVLLIMGILTRAEGPINLASALPTSAPLTRRFASSRPGPIAPNDLRSFLRAPVFRERSGTPGFGLSKSVKPVSPNPPASRDPAHPYTSISDSLWQPVALTGTARACDLKIIQRSVGRRRCVGLWSVVECCDRSVAAQSTATPFQTPWLFAR